MHDLVETYAEITLKLHAKNQKTSKAKRRATFSATKAFRNRALPGFCRAYLAEAADEIANSDENNDTVEGQMFARFG